MSLKKYLFNTKKVVKENRGTTKTDMRLLENRVNQHKSNYNYNIKCECIKKCKDRDFKTGLKIILTKRHI